MISKSLIAAAAVAISVAGLSASQAQAGVDVDVNFGVGVGGFYPGYGYGYGDYPHYYEDDYGISCKKGRKIVRNAHFKMVNTVECEGSSYTYTGWKFGEKYRIRVSSGSGNIISVKHLF